MNEAVEVRGMFEECRSLRLSRPNLAEMGKSETSQLEMSKRHESVMRKYEMMNWSSVK